MIAQELDVLIVDDSRDTADSMAVLLNLMGLRAKAVYSARAALAAVDEEVPLCVILDVHMPDVGGLELVQTLRQKFGESLVLIAVTGLPKDDERAASVFALVDHHFQKPVSPEELAKVLQA